MQFSSRLPIAVHVLLCIHTFDGAEKLTSDFLAGSVNVNPVIIRNTLGKLKAAGLVTVDAVSEAMKAQLKSVSLQALIDDLQSRLRAEQ